MVLVGRGLVSTIGHAVDCEQELLVRQKRLFGKRIDSLADVFHAMDVDSSGFVDTGEWRHALKTLSVGRTDALTQEEVEYLTACVPTAADGGFTLRQFERRFEDVDEVLKGSFAAVRRQHEKHRSTCLPSSGNRVGIE